MIYRSLASVLCQTVIPQEIIIVDDGSSIDVVVPRIPNAPDVPIRLIKVTNRGLPNARNVALMNANGEFFIPLDADDWLYPNYIERTMSLMTSKVDVVLAGLKESGPHRDKSYAPGFNMPYNQVTAELMITTHNRFFYCALFRTETLRKVGGYNGRMVNGYEDWDLWIDLLRRGAQFRAVNDPLFCYDTSNPNSMLHSSDRMRDEIVAEIKKHHSSNVTSL